MQVDTKKLEALGWRSLHNAPATLEFSSVVADSRKAGEGSVFFALNGLTSRGADYIGDVVEKKAAAVFVDERDLGRAKEFAQGRTVFFTHHDFDRQAPRAVSLLLGEPAAGLVSIGVTGTNGKTTICWGLSKMVEALGKRSLYLGTLGYFCGSDFEETGVTTPPMVETANYLRRGQESKAAYALIEASSHGLDQGRLDTLLWNFAIFTNLTPDHGDYHPDMDHYYESKRRLFEALVAHKKETAGSLEGTPAKAPAALINTADGYGKKLYKWLQSQNPDFPVIALEVGVAPSALANARVSSWEASLNGYRARLEYDHPSRGKQSYDLQIPALGSFNLWNYAAIFLTLLSLGFDEASLLKELSRLEGVPGRMEVFRFQGKVAVVDYSHTPDALAKALDTLGELVPRSSLGVVFGCGGDRDRQKRPLMGEVAAQKAGWMIITDDNPRTEEPAQIREEIKKGAGRALVSSSAIDAVPGNESRLCDVGNRREAICAGLDRLQKGDILLVAGKGHEDYQVIGKTKTHFSDREVIEEYINRASGKTDPVCEV